MAYKDSIQRYRQWYGKLLRFYSKPYYERYGEGMEQTFSDVLRERAERNKGLLPCALWVFTETSIELIRTNKTDIIMRNKNVLIIALVTLLLLSVPLIAMQFTNEVNWTLFDFVVMGALLFGTGLFYEFVSRKARNTMYKYALILSVGSGLFMTWVNLAVGIIAREETPANGMYFILILVGIIGGFITRFRAQGLARTLFTMAATHVLITIIAIIVDLDSPWVEIESTLILNIFFTAIWIVCGLMFRRSAARPMSNGQLIMDNGQ